MYTKKHAFRKETRVFNLFFDCFWSFLHNCSKLVAVDFFFFEQHLRNFVKFINMSCEQFFALFISLVDDSFDFFINFRSNFLAYVVNVTVVTAEEYFVICTAV